MKKLVIYHGHLIKIKNETIQTFRPYSEKTAELIDEEATKLVKSAYERTIKLLQDKRDKVKLLAETLLAKETLGHDELVEILGPRPFLNDAYRDYLQNTKEFVHKYEETNKTESESPNVDSKTTETESPNVDSKTTETETKQTNNEQENEDKSNIKTTTKEKSSNNENKNKKN